MSDDEGNDTLRFYDTLDDEEEENALEEARGHLRQASNTLSNDSGHANLRRMSKVRSPPRTRLNSNEKRTSRQTVQTQWSRASWISTTDSDREQDGLPDTIDPLDSSLYSDYPPYGLPKDRQEQYAPSPPRRTPMTYAPPVLPPRTSSTASYFTARGDSDSPPVSPLADGRAPPIPDPRRSSLASNASINIRRRSSREVVNGIPPLSPRMTPRRSSLAPQTSPKPSPRFLDDEILPASDYFAHSAFGSTPPRRRRPSRNPISPTMPEKSLPLTPEEQGRLDMEQMDAKKALKRDRSIKELIGTEWTYAQDLAVIRDVYLARAEGAGIDSIVAKISAAEWTPPVTPQSVHEGFPKTLSPRLSASSPASAVLFGLSTSSSETSTSSTPIYEASASSASLSQTLSSSSSLLPPISPTRVLKNPFSMSRSSSKQSSATATPPNPMTPSDIKAIFLNIVDIATFASAFSGLLDAASKSDPSSDKIGEAFLEMLPRIQSLYQIYCARHGAALIRWEELENSGRLDEYIRETSELTKGITQSWNLNALLIKPVQRCLKYPLLLESILSCTPEEHPDRKNLQIALARMIQVAQDMNEAKKRTELISRIVNLPERKKSGPAAPSKAMPENGRRPIFSTRRSRQNSASNVVPEQEKRRASAPSMVPQVSSTFSQSLSKKIGRSGQRVKAAAGFQVDIPLDTALLDELCASFELQHDLLSRWPEEVFQWSANLGSVLSSQRRLTAAWAEVYKPMDDEVEVRGGMLDVLVKYDLALKYCHNTIWQDACNTIDRLIVPNVEMLLDEFAKPKLLIHKRSLKLLDHQRSRKFSIDSSPAFQDYHTLSLVLTDELPVFLTAIRQAFDTIVVALAHLQSATFAKFHKTFEQFQGNCFDSLEANRTIMGQFWQQYSSFADMLDSFTSTSTERVAAAAGVSADELGRRVSAASSTTSSFARPARSRTSSTNSVQSVSSSTAGVHLGQVRPRANTGSMPAPPARQVSQNFTSANRDSIVSTTPSFQSFTFSAKASTSSSSPLDGDPVDGVDKLPVLFQAVTILDCSAEGQRDGYPYLKTKPGEELAVLFEDKDEEGEQWLLARVNARNNVGFIRSASVVAM